MKEKIDPDQLKRILRDSPMLDEDFRMRVLTYIEENGIPQDLEKTAGGMENLGLRTSDRGLEEIHDELLNLVGGGANLYQQAEGVNRNSWFVTILEKYFGFEISEE